jgi:hypothetical protein
VIMTAYLQQALATHLGPEETQSSFYSHHLER